MLLPLLSFLPMHFPARLLQLLNAASDTQNERMVVGELLDGMPRKHRVRHLTGATT